MLKTLKRPFADWWLIDAHNFSKVAQQGIEIAKRQGKYKGKIREYGPHSPNRQKRYIYKEACRLLNRKKDGDETLTKRQIARMLGIAPVTLYRIEKYQAEDLANVPRSER